jgi:hypothetical protein
MKKDTIVTDLPIIKEWSRCVNCIMIKQYHFNRHNFPAILSLFTSIGQSVKELVFDMARIQAKQLWQLLSLIPNVEEIHLIDVALHYLQYVPEQIPQNFRKLKYLTIISGSAESGGF